MVKTETLPGRTDHEVYPTRYMITIGSVGGGFKFYGPFKEHVTAIKWVRIHLDKASKLIATIEPMYHVGEDK